MFAQCRRFKKYMEKEIRISSEEPSEWLLKEIAEAEKEIKKGNVSPFFDNAKDAIEWLDNKNRKYGSRV